MVALILAVVAVPAADGKKKDKVASYRATAVQQDVGGAALFVIEIFEWSTPEQRQALIQAYDDGGQEGIYKYLNQQEDKGFVRPPNTRGYQMRYAYEFENDGKRQVVLATDRPILFGEARARSRSEDNSVSMVYLELDSETDQGTGQMVLGAELHINKETGKLTIERVAQHPIRFTRVQSTMKKD